eukprot:TRINITY_DN14110_c0_g1_i2.p2 TRINITY_DN14110_c0_g1~~TRINITY_DN14110_c0_g1_i2.p2  ORF type:complete len:109 (-),score=17.82 TRINITY_DN14110_c0_g1_i2:1-327(-)
MLLAKLLHISDEISFVLLLDAVGCFLCFGLFLFLVVAGAAVSPVAAAFVAATFGAVSRLAAGACWCYIVCWLASAANTLALHDFREYTRCEKSSLSFADSWSLCLVLV